MPWTDRTQNAVLLVLGSLSMLAAMFIFGYVLTVRLAGGGEWHIEDAILLCVGLVATYLGAMLTRRLRQDLEEQRMVDEIARMQEEDGPL